MHIISTYGIRIFELLSKCFVHSKVKKANGSQNECIFYYWIANLQKTQEPTKEKIHEVA